MAEQEPHGLASTFPNPPSFWQDFTPENVARIKDLRAAHLRSDPGRARDPTPLRLPSVPEDLLRLQPPAEPADGRWRVFGDHYTLNDQLPTLEEQGIENLPASSGPPGSRDSRDKPKDKHNNKDNDNDNDNDNDPDPDPTNYDRAFELKRMAKSILLNFLELAGVLAQNPSHAEPKITDIRTLFINMHHILNEYRPHQARESAIELMQSHLDKTQAETIAIRSQVEKARRVLEGLGSLSIAALQDDAAGQMAAMGGMAGVGGIGGIGVIGGSGQGQGEGEGEGEEGTTRMDLKARREAEVWAATDALFA